MEYHKYVHLRKCLLYKKMNMVNTNNSEVRHQAGKSNVLSTTQVSCIINCFSIKPQKKAHDFIYFGSYVLF